MPLPKQRRLELERQARLLEMQAGSLTRGHPLAIGLSAAVPLRIMEYRIRGGPSEEDIERARRFARVLGEKGDILQYRGRKPGETAEVFNGLADALAVMAFCPGGVTIFGDHYESH